MLGSLFKAAVGVVTLPVAAIADAVEVVTGEVDTESHTGKTFDSIMKNLEDVVDPDKWVVVEVGKVIETIYLKVPKSNLISNLEIISNNVRFSWLGKRFSVSQTLSVETVEGSLLLSGRDAILMGALLKSN